MGVGVIAFKDAEFATTVSAPPFDPDAYLASKPPFDPTKPYEVVNPPASLTTMAAWATIPPTCLFVFGLAFWWVARGFNASKN